MGITRRTMTTLERQWLRKLAAVNEQLEDARTMKEYMAVLQDARKWNSLSFSLRRYVYRHFVGPQEKAVPYTVRFGGQEYHFSPVTVNAPISEAEKWAYADLLYRMTLQNRCFAKREDGSPNEKMGAISKQQYLNYLSGKRIYRGTLFTLSMALGFDTAEMERFMSVLGESPVYNFRAAGECIYYFCHSVPALRTMEMVEELERRYGEMARKTETQPAGMGMTEELHRKIDAIIDGDYEDEDRRKEAFLRYMVENAHQFTGYSRTARALLEEELYTTRLLDVQSAQARNRRLGREVFADLGEQDLFVYASRDAMGREIHDAFTGRGEYRTVPLRVLGLDRRLTANFPDGAHFRSALFDEEDSAELGRSTPHEQVTKTDFLLVRLYKLEELGDLTEQQRLELLHQFQLSTDQLLEKAGMPPIYVANPMDHMVMSALCTPDPAGFVRGVFRMAPRRGEKFLEK